MDATPLPAINQVRTTVKPPHEKCHPPCCCVWQRSTLAFGAKSLVFDIRAQTAQFLSTENRHCKNVTPPYQFQADTFTMLHRGTAPVNRKQTLRECYTTISEPFEMLHHHISFTWTSHTTVEDTFLMRCISRISSLFFAEKQDRTTRCQLFGSFDSFFMQVRKSFVVPRRGGSRILVGAGAVEFSPQGT